MELAKKIQVLRKQQGLSQEQLAEQLGISRQAVSKWEAGQSVPELEKLLPMSQLFGVTTDYLLDDDLTEPQRKIAAQPTNSKRPAAISIGFIIAGLILAAAGWKEWQTYLPVGLGLFLQIAGCLWFEATYHTGSTPSRYSFYALQVWLLSPIPMMVVGQWALRFLSLSYKVLYVLLGFWVLYVLWCAAVTAVLLLLKKRYAS